MNRKDKIQLLKAIEAGVKDVKALAGPHTYVFIERSSNPGFFERNGIEYNKEQYRNLIQGIENRRDNSKVIRLKIVRNAEDLNNEYD